MFDTVDAARLEPGLMAIFEPRIEQFSFANSRETGGVYTAVTIRYQILIYAPNGELVETLTLTGYGSGPAPKIGNGEEELGIAAFAAMRDAAAKFLTQFPGLEVAKPLLASQALVPEGDAVPGSPEAAAAVADMTIEAVPINDSGGGGDGSGTFSASFGASVVGAGAFSSAFPDGDSVSGDDTLISTLSMKITLSVGTASPFSMRGA